MTTNRRPACIILTATKGDIRTAKTVFTGIARKVLGGGFCKAPWHCGYYGPRELEHDCSPRWTLDVSDAEFAALIAEMKPAYTGAGWSGVPLDCYRD